MNAAAIHCSRCIHGQYFTKTISSERYVKQNYTRFIGKNHFCLEFIKKIFPSARTHSFLLAFVESNHGRQTCKWFEIFALAL